MSKLVCLNLGAGTQSTALFLLYVALLRGEKTPEGLGPPPSVALFADTGDEPRNILPHVHRLQDEYGDTLPIRIVRRPGPGIIEQTFQVNSAGKSRTLVPLFVVDKAGNRGMTLRKCTGTFKAEPIRKEIRSMLGLRPRERAKGKRVVQVFGITRDEVQRCRQSPDAWIDFFYPLVEMRWTRSNCIEYLKERSVSVGKSACMVCSYHSDRFWLDQKKHDPEAFEHACQYDEKLRAHFKTGATGLINEPFLHRSCRPLRDVILDADKQLSLFEGECGGYCGS